MNRTLRSDWNSWWYSPQSPINLAICRIVFFGGILLFYLRVDFAAWGDVPAEFRFPHTLLGNLGVEPAASETLTAFAWLWRASLLLACAGFLTRFHTVVAFVLGWYLLDLRHNFGTVSHNDAPLILIMFIMCLSRCGAALSIDAALRKNREPVPASGEFRWPIRAAWLVLALVMFAAGVAKFRYGGLLWFHPDNLAICLIEHHYRDLSYPPWTDYGLLISRSPGLCTGIALFTALTEILFPLALFFVRARVLLVSAAFAMQLGVRAILGPPFEQFVFVYLFFVPWGLLLLAPQRRPVRAVTGSFGSLVHAARAGMVTMLSSMRTSRARTPSPAKPTALPGGLGNAPSIRLNCRIVISDKKRKRASFRSP